MRSFSATARAFQSIASATILAVFLLALSQPAAQAKPTSRFALDRHVVAPITARKHIPRGTDTDRDGLSDRTEARRTKTNPRRADTDGDGFSDGEEISAGSDPRNPLSTPSPAEPPEEGEPEPPPPPGPEGPVGSEPVKAIWTPPSGAQVGVPVTLNGTASSGDALNCEWSFENQSGSAVFQKKSGCEIEVTFESTGTKYVRLLVKDESGSSDSNKQSFAVDEPPQTEPPDEEPPVEEPPAEEPPEEEEPESEPPPPPLPTPSGCADGATVATTAVQVRSAVQSNDDICVTADVGDVNLSSLGERPVVVSTDGGSMGSISLSSTTDLTISGARFRSITLRGSHRTKLLGNTIGGTQTNRVYDQLIFMPETNNDVTIEGNDIGWTLADNSGNTGYGCRCYGTLNRLRFVGNRLHDLAADGFQGVGGSDVLIDRNEIGPVGRNPGSSEHSDNIQITGNGENLRITNNWLHHQGYYEGNSTANAGSTYIHGGSTGSLLYENNLIEIAQGRTEICGLGTGGTSRSNITIRRNTWVDGGRAFTGFPGFEWDCDSGSGNTVERNVAVDPDGGFAQDGSAGAATFSANLFGQPSLVSLDADGNCTSANCNPTEEEPIGYRKPSGVSW